MKTSLGASALLLLTAAPAMAQASDPATVPVNALDTALLEAMKSHAGFSARAARLAPVIDRAFDIPLITRLTVGSTWNSIPPGEQTQLVNAIRRLTVAEYAKNFDSWGGEAFRLDPNVQSRGTDKFVKTELTRPRQSPVSLIYRLRQSGGQWKIIDVLAKGSISQLATRRADYARVLASGGPRMLIQHLDELADKAAR